MNETRVITMTEFQERMAGLVQQKLPEGYSVTTGVENKNNTLKISTNTLGSARISANIYLEKYYQAYLEGRCAEDLAEELADFYMENTSGKEELTDLVSSMYSYTEIQDSIRCRLVGRKNNKSYLEDKLYVSFLDMAVLFYIPVQIDGSFVSFTLTNNLFQKWNISEEQLFSDALDNMYRENCSCTPITMVIGRLSGMIPPEECLSGDILDMVEQYPDELMYVLIQENMDTSFGASALLRKDILKKLYDHFQTGFFLLPLSIHECILLLDDGETDVENLVEMVSFTNKTCVLEDVLTDSVYYYGADGLTILKEG